MTSPTTPHERRLTALSDCEARYGRGWKRRRSETKSASPVTWKRCSPMFGAAISPIRNFMGARPEKDPREWRLGYSTGRERDASRRFRRFGVFLFGNRSRKCCWFRTIARPNRMRGRDFRGKRIRCWWLLAPGWTRLAASGPWRGFVWSMFHIKADRRETSQLGGHRHSVADLKDVVAPCEKHGWKSRTTTRLRCNSQ